MSETRTIIERDGLRLHQTKGPNAYLVVTRLSDNREIVSTPCVVTEDKDQIIRLLFAAWLSYAEPAERSEPAAASVPQGGELHLAVYGENSASSLPMACGVECSTWDKPLKYTFEIEEAGCLACLRAYARERWKAVNTLSFKLRALSSAPGERT
jgi:hypothetical protein